MPKMSKVPALTRPSARRSSRLRDKDLKAVEAGGPSRQRRRKTSTSATDLFYANNSDPASSMQKPCVPLDLRRSRRMTASELTQRESSLLKEEQLCRRRAMELDERDLSISKRENELSSQVAEIEARASLAQLEEHFTCALCYEIMAHPYTLNPSQCGHTFCALCILKWFFSRLHLKCGAWHESVDCPICRSLLVITPDGVPRHDTTFPFVPNRTAAAVCESFVEKLRITSAATPVVKREEKEAMWEGETECSRKDAATDKKVNEDADVAGWREGGLMRTEWLKKDREGRKEMNHIVKEWRNLTSHDFRNLKQKLGV